MKFVVKFDDESGLEWRKTANGKRTFRLLEGQVSFRDQWRSDPWPAISASTVSAKSHECQDDAVVVWMLSGVIANLIRNIKVGRLVINDPENNEDFVTFRNDIEYSVA